MCKVGAMIKTVVVASVCLAACVREPVKLQLKAKPDAVLNKKGQTFELRAALYDKDGLIMDPLKPLTWSSADPAVATVDKDGVIAAVGSGETTVTGRYDTLSDSAEVKVRVIGSVTLAPAEPQTLRLGKTLQLTAKTLDDKGRTYEGPKVRFSASSHCIEVDDVGLVTAQALGECEAYAAVGDRVASVRIKVKD